MILRCVRRHELTGGWSTGSCTSARREFSDGICPSGMGRGRRFTAGSGVGRVTACRLHWWEGLGAGASSMLPALAGPGSTQDGEPGSGHTEPNDHVTGRSRRGPITKIHLACDGHGWPLSVLLTSSNSNDCTMFSHGVIGIGMARRRHSRTRLTAPAPSGLASATAASPPRFRDAATSKPTDAGAAAPVVAHQCSTHSGTSALHGVGMSGGPITSSPFQHHAKLG